MTILLATNIGSYPRIGEEKDHQRHRRAQGHFERKEISAHAMRDVEQSVVQDVVREQIALGMDEVTDGLVPWSDPVSGVCSRLTNVRLSGLARYFDANFYYRKPVLLAKPRRKSPIAVNEFRYTRSISSKRVRVVLPGPVTLARLTEGGTAALRPVAARIKLFTGILAEEIAELAKEGAPVIQVDEPALARHPEDLPLFLNASAVFRTAAGASRLALALYYAPLASLAGELGGAPYDVLHLDFTRDGESLFQALLARPPAAMIGFGVVDARTTRTDSIEPLVERIRAWRAKTNPEFLYVTPSAGLEELPRETAAAKLRLVARLKEELEKDLAGAAHGG